MSQRKSPEFKTLMGVREANDDGFTYRYGKHRNGYVKKQRHQNGIERSKRNDKRSARQAELKRIADEE